MLLNICLCKETSLVVTESLTFRSFGTKTVDFPEFAHFTSSATIARSFSLMISHHHNSDSIRSSSGIQYRLNTFGQWYSL